MEFNLNISVSVLIIGTATSSDHHSLHCMIQKEDRHIAELTHQLEVVTREKNESHEVVTKLRTKLQECKQQLLKTTG